MIGVLVIAVLQNMVMAISMNDRAIGIVLSHTDYKDNAILLHVLTKEYGKISFVARGARKITSKQQGSILPFSKGEFLFDYREGKTIFTMKQVKSLDLHRVFLTNFDAQIGASMVCEIVNAFVNPAMEQYEVMEVFDLLDTTLTYMEEGTHVGLLTSMFLSSMLKITGFGVVVDECSLCGSLTIASISIKDGGFLCDRCMYQEGVSSYDANTLRNFRYINKANINDYNVLKDIVSEKECCLSLMMEFLEFHTGMRIRSYRFYKEFYGGR